MADPLDLGKRVDRRPITVTFLTTEANDEWLMGYEQETGQSRSFIMDRILTKARTDIGPVTTEGERRQGERRTA